MGRLRNVTFSEILEKYNITEKKINKILDTEGKYLRSIYDRIHQKTVLIENALNDSKEKDFEIIINTIIRKYHQFTELGKGNHTDKEIQETVMFIRNELNSLFIEFSKITDEIKNDNIKNWQCCKTKGNSKNIGRAYFQENNLKRERNEESMEKLVISSLEIYKKQLQIEFNIHTINQFKSFFELKMDEFNCHLDKIYHEFQIQREKKQKFLINSLNDFKKIFFEIKQSDTELLENLKKTSLIFLEKFGIKPMDTAIGDKFSLEKHIIIREILNPLVADKYNNTITEIHFLGFTLNGKPYFPAQVNIQIKPKNY